MTCTIVDFIFRVNLSNAEVGFLHLPSQLSGKKLFLVSLTIHSLFHSYILLTHIYIFYK